MNPLIRNIISSSKGKGFIIPNGINLEDYGDSITVGQAASNWATDKSSTYVGLLKTYLNAGSSSINRAQGGTGVFSASGLASVNLTIAYSGLVTIMSGYNDIRRGGSTTLNYNKIIGAYRHIISMACMDQIWFGNTGIFTNSGTWGIAIGSISLLGGNGSGDRANTGTKTATINGNNFSFGFIGCNPTNPFYNFGTVKITIDGVVYHNITLNDKTDGLLGNDTYQCGIYTVNVFGLSSGNHSLIIEATGDVIFNYMAKMSDIDICNSVIALSPVYSTQWTTNSPYNNGSNAAVDIISSLINNVVSEYKSAGLPVIYVDPKTYFNIATDFDIDGIHPIDIGHYHIFLACKNEIKKISVNQIFNNLQQIVYSGTKNGYRTKTAGTDWSPCKGLGSFYLPATMDGYVTIDLPNQSDCDFGMLALKVDNTIGGYSTFKYGFSYYGYDATPNLKSLVDGALGSNISSGWLATGGKLRLGRFSGVVKLQYASNGTAFVDSYTFGSNSAAFYLGLNMIKNVFNKWMYNIQLSSNWIPV